MRLNPFSYISSHNLDKLVEILCEAAEMCEGSLGFGRRGGGGGGGVVIDI